MKFFTFAVWLAGACAASVGVKAQIVDPLITPANTVNYLKVVGNAAYTSLELHRAATDVGITAVGAFILTAEYGYHDFIRNLDGIDTGLKLVDATLQPLTADITTLAGHADQHTVPQSDFNAMNTDLNNLGNAISQLCSYIEEVLTFRAQRTLGTKTLDDITADLKAVSASCDNLIKAILVLKSANYALFQFFLCGVVFLSDLCGALHHAARALEDLGIVITYKVQALAATEPDAVTKVGNLNAALNELASKLRGICTALSKLCLGPL